MVQPSRKPDAPHGRGRPVACRVTLLPAIFPSERHSWYSRLPPRWRCWPALIAAGFGSLPVRLVFDGGAVAPAACWSYIHDHRLWHEPSLSR